MIISIFLIAIAQSVKNHTIIFIPFIKTHNKVNHRIISNFLYNSSILYLLIINELNTITLIRLRNTNINIYMKSKNKAKGIQIILIKSRRITTGVPMIVTNPKRKLFPVCFLRFSAT